MSFREGLSEQPVELKVSRFPGILPPCLRLWQQPGLNGVLPKSKSPSSSWIHRSMTPDNRQKSNSVTFPSPDECPLSPICSHPCCGNPRCIVARTPHPQHCSTMHAMRALHVPYLALIIFCTAICRIVIPFQVVGSSANSATRTATIEPAAMPSYLASRSFSRTPLLPRPCTMALFRWTGDNVVPLPLFFRDAGQWHAIVERLSISASSVLAAARCWPRSTHATTWPTVSAVRRISTISTCCSHSTTSLPPRCGCSNAGSSSTRPGRNGNVPHRQPGNSGSRLSRWACCP